jgi:hypothetical protein
MGATKTTLIFFTALFYIGITLFYGFAVDDIPSLNGYSQTNLDSATPLGGESSNEYEYNSANIPKASFFGNIVTGFSNTPIWLNALIFSPLVIMLIYILLTSLVPFIGGGD